MYRILGIIVLCIIVLAFSYGMYVMRPAAHAAAQPTPFLVEKGESFSSVSHRLAEEGIIRSEKALVFFGVLTGASKHIKSGSYQFSPAMSVPEIVRELTQGPDNIVITILEGETARDIDRKLSEAGVTPKGSFLEIALDLEGFLFPDTYYFQPDMEARAVLQKFLDNFEKRVGELYPDLVEKGVDENNEELYNLLIVASLVEREVPHEEDRALVSGIFYKRLEVGMPLQVDATVAYIACGRVFYSCELKKSDFQRESSYNTYLRVGLPPTPIANPGISAIRAAREPEVSDYLYYLSHPETRETLFSKTFAEHDEKRAEYLR